MLPPIPSWDGLHPIIVHFPIALLLIAPILIVLGVIFYNKNGKAFLVSAFVLMLVGTIAAFIATSTGEAAGELAERIPGVEPVLENHEELAETTRNIFAALTAVFGAIVFLPAIFKKELGQKTVALVSVAFLLFYAAGSVVLMNTAHEGGRLVHEFGVRAMMSGGTQPATQTKQKSADDDDD